MTFIQFFNAQQSKPELQPAYFAEHISVGGILQRLALRACEEETVVLVLEGVENCAVARLVLAIPHFNFRGL